MGINVCWQDERGDRKQCVDDPYMLFSRMIRSEEAAETVILKYIDAYGDMTFNQLQIPDLLMELKHARGWSLSKDTLDHLERVIGLIVLSSGEIHTDIKFSGD